MRKKFAIPIGSMMGDVLRSFFRKPVTQRYPFERTAAPKTFRGKLTWDLSKCTGCMLCIKDCPANAIELIVVDRANKRFVLRFHADRCTYCSQCRVNCRFKCLNLSSEDWELAALSKEPFTVYYGRDVDINAFLAEAGQKILPGQQAASEHKE
jgi:formate hydrogenlyase subunit 6/NADH:ubiquinone oxidoreductase subunit I